MFAEMFHQAATARPSDKILSLWDDSTLHCLFAKNKTKKTASRLSSNIAAAVTPHFGPVERARKTTSTAASQLRQHFLVAAVSGGRNASRL